MGFDVSPMSRGGRRPRGETCRTGSANRRIRPHLGREEQPVDLDRWLELADVHDDPADDDPPARGSLDDADAEDREAARRLRDQLLEVLDDPTKSIVPMSAEMGQDEWDQLPGGRRRRLRIEALRHLDPRLVPRTVRHALNRGGDR